MQQRHLLVGPPRVGLVSSSSDLNSYDNSMTSTTVCDHSFSHAHNEPNMMQIVALASQTSGRGPTCFGVSASGAAFGDTSKQQRHLPGDPPKVGLCRSHEPGEPYHPVDSDYGRDASFNVACSMQPLQAVFGKTAIPWLFLALLSRSQGNRIELRLTRLLH